MVVRIPGLNSQPGYALKGLLLVPAFTGQPCLRDE